MLTDAKRQSNARWEAKQDKHLLRMPPGKKAVVQKHASKLGKSLNGYINDLIDQDMSRDITVK